MYPQEAYLYDPPIQAGDVGAPWLETTEYRGANGGSVYGVDAQALLPPMPQGPPPQSEAEAEAEGLLGNDPRRVSHPPEMPPPATGASFRSMMTGYTQISPAPSAEHELEAEVGHSESAVVSPYEDEESTAAPTAFEPGAFVRNDENHHETSHE
jgi:hypothetical protein